MCDYSVLQEHGIQEMLEEVLSSKPIHNIIIGRLETVCSCPQLGTTCHDDVITYCNGKLLTAVEN